MSSEKIIDAAERAWWLSVLAGETSRPHPVFVDLQATVDNGEVIVRGRVPTDEAHASIVETMQTVCGDRIENVRDEIIVQPDDTGDDGLLKQTVIGTFGDEKQAEFALEYLTGRLGPAAQGARLTLVRPGSKKQRAIPKRFREDAGEALEEGKTLLAATVDETLAFHLRKLLDEETQSEEVLIAPPEPIAGDASGPASGADS